MRVKIIEGKAQVTEDKIETDIDGKDIHRLGKLMKTARQDLEDKINEFFDDLLREKSRMTRPRILSIQHNIIPAAYNEKERHYATILYE